MFHSETLSETCDAPCLVVIADDFTGALDTGIKMTQHGAMVSVVNYERIGCRKDCDVLVVNAETRHLDPQEAYERICDIASRFERTPYIYLKVDSALRGQIAVSIRAIFDTLDLTYTAFAPAYPEMNRLTKDGRQLIDGFTLDESEFADDCLNPVSGQYVRDLFDGVGSLRVFNNNLDLSPDTHEPSVVIFDAETDSDLSEIAKHLDSHRALRFAVGCAGFAAALAPFYGFDKTVTNNVFTVSPLAIFNGSLHPNTQRQIDYGASNGYRKFYFDPLTSACDPFWYQQLSRAFAKRENIIITTNGNRDNSDYESIIQESIRFQRAAGLMLGKLLQDYDCGSYVLMIVGGDTLLGFLKQIDFPEIDLLAEVSAGVVAFRMRVKNEERVFLSKSGSFGARELFVDLIKGGAEAYVSLQNGQ